MSRRYSFSQWLAQQVGRGDSVGEFARYVMSDDKAPLGSFRPATWRRYLKQSNAPEYVIDGVTPAFQDFAHRSDTQPLKQSGQAEGSGELGQGWAAKMLTVSDLLALPPETREQSYRRGYRDGFIAALQAAYGVRPIPAELWRFWEDVLLEWQKRAEGESTEAIELPPTWESSKGQRRQGE